MARYDYEIGATVGGMQNVEDLGINPPVGEYFEASEYVDAADGQRIARGFPTASWRFGILTGAMIEILRGYIGSSPSGTVFIATRVPPDDTSDVELFPTFQAVMIWPAGLMRQRRFTGKYLDVEIEFRRLVIQP